MDTGQDLIPRDQVREQLKQMGLEPGSEEFIQQLEANWLPANDRGTHYIPMPDHLREVQVKE